MNKKYLDRDALVYLWAQIKAFIQSTMAGFAKTVNGRTADENGNITLTHGDMNAYPEDGIQHAPLSVSVGMWGGEGPFSYVIGKSYITDKTICFIEYSGTEEFDVDITYETSAGQCILYVDKIPSVPLVGTIVFMLTSPEATDALPYPSEGIRTIGFTIDESQWTGNGPYTVTIKNSGVTINTQCRFTFLEGDVHVVSRIGWVTDAGTITLTTSDKPIGLISGNITLIETKGEAA